MTRMHRDPLSAAVVTRAAAVRTTPRALRVVAEVSGSAWTSVRTQVGIVGAGPAGLVLAQLLHRNGIDSVIVENRSREYVIDRVRAGVLEQGTVDLLMAMGVGAGVQQSGLRHDGLYLSFQGQRHHINLTESDRRPGHHRLRAERSRAGSDRCPRRDLSSAVFRVRTGLRSRRRGVADDPLSSWRGRPRDRLRLHCRLRRVPWHLPSVDS